MFTYDKDYPRSVSDSRISRSAFNHCVFRDLAADPRDFSCDSCLVLGLSVCNCLFFQRFKVVCVPCGLLQPHAAYTVGAALLRRSKHATGFGFVKQT